MSRYYSMREVRWCWEKVDNSKLLSEHKILSPLSGPQMILEFPYLDIFLLEFFFYTTCKLAVLYFSNTLNLIFINSFPAHIPLDAFVRPPWWLLLLFPFKARGRACPLSLELHCGPTVDYIHGQFKFSILCIARNLKSVVQLLKLWLRKLLKDW